MPFHNKEEQPNPKQRPSHAEPQKPGSIFITLEFLRLSCNQITLDLFTIIIICLAFPVSTKFYRVVIKSVAQLPGFNSATHYLGSIG